LGDTIKSPVEKKEKQSQMSDTIEDLGTIEDLEFDFDPLCRLEIFQTGNTTQSIPILKREITIGRDVEERAADVRLKSNNRKISQLHAKLQLKDNGEIWVTALNKNPTIAGKKTIRNDETVRIETDEEIQIYEFTLRLKFKE
jgi:predicted component of type VI protein secretion system